jgi:uncharacterized protein (TIGR03086 family)
MNLLDFHAQCLSWTEALLERACGHEDQAVPGTTWNVGDLAAHLAAVNVMCASSAAGIGPEAMPDVSPLVAKGAIDAVRTTSTAFSQAFADQSILSTTVPTPVGPHNGSVVLTQGSLEHLIHGYDLATAIGADATMPAALVTEALGRIVEQPALFAQFREMGMYAPPSVAAPNAGPQERLLAALGR